MRKGDRMKVEFKDTPFGKSLCIKTSDFLKIKNNIENSFCQEEMDSFIIALRSFTSYMNTELRFDFEELEKILIAIYKQAKKNRGTIIFQIKSTEYDRLPMPELKILLCSNDGILQILYED